MKNKMNFGTKLTIFAWVYFSILVILSIFLFVFLLNTKFSPLLLVMFLTLITISIFSFIFFLVVADFINDKVENSKNDTQNSNKLFYEIVNERVERLEKQISKLEKNKE